MKFPSSVVGRAILFLGIAVGVSIFLIASPFVFYFAVKPIWPDALDVPSPKPFVQHVHYALICVGFGLIRNPLWSCLSAISILLTIQRSRKVSHAVAGIGLFSVWPLLGSF